MTAATIAILSVAFTAPATAQSAACTGGGKISKQIAKQMIAAQDAMKAKKWQASLDKLKEAEAQPGAKSAFDQFHMSEIRGYIYNNLHQDADAARELEAGLNSPCLPESKKTERLKTLVNAYTRLRNYPKAIDFGTRALKGAPNDIELKVIVAQAYFQSGNNKEAVRLMTEVIDGQGKPKENDLLLVQAACAKVGDNACKRKVFEKLVSNYPKPDYWLNLMTEMGKNENDLQNLNVLRLQSHVNVMKLPENYKEYAQLALDEKLSCEAQTILEEGFTKKIFVDKRDIDVNTRLLNTAKPRCVTEKSSVAAAENQAAQAATGDEFVKAGAQQLVSGNFAKAAEDIQKGITKGSLAKGDPNEGSRNDEAYILLGIAHMKNKNVPEAQKAFRAVKKDPTMVSIARLWLLSL